MVTLKGEAFKPAHKNGCGLLSKKVGNPYSKEILIFQ
jgi:hypothetical protein